MRQEIWLGYLLGISESLSNSISLPAWPESWGRELNKDTACGCTSDTESGLLYNQ